MMTKEEFIEFLDELDDRQQPLTEEELLNVCLKHKHELAKKDKDWAGLADWAGTGQSGDALRNWTNYREVPTESESEDAEQAEESPFMKLYKAQQKVRDEWTAARKLARDEARIEVLEQAVKDTAKSLGKLPEIKVKESKNTASGTEAVLMLSDLHIGVDCMNYVNVYNPSVAAVRLKRLAEETVRYCQTMGVETLHCLNLGDMISGLIHINARIVDTLDVVSQIMTAAELLSKFMNAIQNAAPNIDYRSVTDNHSRATPNKNEHIEKENFNRLIDWYLEERLSGTKIEFKHDNIDIGIGQLALKNGKYVIFAHGHQDSPDQSFQHMAGLTGRVVDYVLLAHYHTPKQKEYQHTTVIVNGSIVGTEEYAFSRRLFSDPSQKLLVFDNHNLMNIDIKLSEETY